MQKDDIVKNFEMIKNKAVIYSFADKAEVESYLNNKGINATNLHQVPMSLEDAFIGITGKY
jgi:ABC-2 type transport system ATP-binding protein